MPASVPVSFLSGIPPREAIAFAAALVLLLALALLALLLVRRSRRRARRVPAPEPRPELEAKARPAPPLPPEDKKAAEARRKAEYDARKAAERAARTMEPAGEAAADRAAAEQAAREAAAHTEAERRELERQAKAIEEERKKEAYRQRKEEERAERERRRQEQEEAARLEREEAERLAREAEEARRREEEERQRRIEAEGGRTLAAGLEKTRGGFMARLNALFSGSRMVDDRVLADLEEVLFTADIGVHTATTLLEAARERARSKELADPDRLKAVLRSEIERIVSLEGAGKSNGAPAGTLETKIGDARPWVVMVVGVNGSGKTTTVGKLAAKLRQSGHRVLLGAGDTFRAAAGEQLEIWAERVGAPIVRGAAGADPASVCFEAVKTGIEQKVDVVICDTAGRLHTKVPLMEELKKVQRVMSKALPGAPHEVLLVVDATTGQNAIAQARQFNEALGVTGIALTKLDGTAKGGVIIGICDELRIPVRYVGVGEQVADLRPFAPREFVEALFG